jgi:hypothetical protein
MIGHDEAGQGVAIDSEKLIGTHAAIIGNTGSGKTFTVRKVLEQLWGVGVHIVFDPEQEFHTLRQLHPYVIVGGPRADVARPAPAALAAWILETKSSVIVQFEDDEDLEDQRGFIGAFLDALMMQPRRLWQPAFIVIDEAHRYAPQEEGASSKRPICTLLSQGRKRGFTGILCTQRLAKITKNATGDCNTWIVGRVGQVIDRNAAANNLGFPLRSDEALGLRDLEPGQFWGFGVALTKRPVLIKVAATASQHLKLGERFEPTPLPFKPKIPPVRAARGSLAGWSVAAGLALIVCGLALLPHML